MKPVNWKKGTRREGVDPARYNQLTKVKKIIIDEKSNVYH